MVYILCIKSMFSNGIYSEKFLRSKNSIEFYIVWQKECYYCQSWKSGENHEGVRKRTWTIKGRRKITCRRYGEIEEYLEKISKMKKMWPEMSKKTAFLTKTRGENRVGVRKRKTTRKKILRPMVSILCIKSMFSNGIYIMYKVDVFQWYLYYT